MFNGIIKNTGIINKIYKKKNNFILEIFSKMHFSKKALGSSISCSGVCLTVEKFIKNLFIFYVSKETLSKTIFKSLKKDDIINLEKPLKYGQRVSGHFVQGHVDTTSAVKKIHFLGRSCLINFKLSKKYKKHMVLKGSITINGVSLEPEDWVGAFNGEVCVGARKWDISACSDGICDVPVQGYDGTDLTAGYMIAGETPTFKIYDASENLYYNATPSENVSPWEYQLEVEIIGLNGISLSSKYDGTMPVTYSIYNIYPNPFNPITSIEYSLPENADIELIVYNIQGRHIKTLIQCFQTAGYHSINWNAQNYPSGVYLIRLESNTYNKTQKVVLFK